MKMTRKYAKEIGDFLGRPSLPVAVACSMIFSKQVKTCLITRCSFARMSVAFMAKSSLWS
jgi:hypothetical protein